MGNIPRRRLQTDQKIGYGNPPRHGMWKPGQSGNPKGRPKGTRNFKTDVQATLRAPVRVTRDGKPQKISTQKALLCRLLEKGLSAGDIRALYQLLQLASIYNNEELAVSDSLAVDDEKVLGVYQQRLLSGAASASSDPIGKTTGNTNTSASSVEPVHKKKDLLQ